MSRRQEPRQPGPVTTGDAGSVTDVETRRMFVAVVPPEHVLAHLQAALTPHRDLAGGARWTLVEQWHVTLAFLPSVPDRAVPPLVERLRRAATRGGPLAARVAGAGAFPRPARATVLWAGVAGDDETLRRLAAATQAAGRRAGVEVAGGPFRPHLTVARLPRPGDARRWADALGDYTGPAWIATEITLVASRLGAGPGGRAVHETLHRLPLGGR